MTRASISVTIAIRSPAKNMPIFLAIRAQVEHRKLADVYLSRLPYKPRVSNKTANRIHLVS